MKVKYWLIIIAVAVLVFFGLGMLAGYFAFRCDPAIGPIVIAKPEKPSPPKYYKPEDVAKQCGDTIELLGNVYNGRFSVLAWDECKGVERSWSLGLSGPIHRHSVFLAGHILAGYNNDVQKFGALAGGTLGYMRNFSRLSVGAGVTYLHGVVNAEYYAGASLIGKIDF